LYRKRQKLSEQPTHDEIDLSRNIENYEQEATSVVSNSMQNPSTFSDRQSPSREITPEVSIAIANDDEEKVEMTSIVRVKDFEDYVKQAIQSGLLDKQYEVSSELRF